MVRILRAIAWVARRSPRNKQHKVFVPRRRNIFYPPWIGSEVHDASPSFATRRSQSPTPSLNATQTSHKPKSYPPQPSPRSVSNPKRYDLTNYYSSSLQQQLIIFQPAHALHVVRLHQMSALLISISESVSQDSRARMDSEQCAPNTTPAST